VGCPASDRIARVRPYSGTNTERRCCLNPALTVSGGVFQTPYSHSHLSLRETAVSPYPSSNPLSATPAGLTRIRFGLTPVRSPLLRGYSLFLGVREMFQFPRCPPYRVTAGAVGLPHSDIVGLSATRASPTLFAALSRPSSARSAKAFTMCSSCLLCRNPSGRSCTCLQPTSRGSSWIEARLVRYHSVRSRGPSRAFTPEPC
jgi:hypothetical protein